MAGIRDASKFSGQGECAKDMFKLWEQINSGIRPGQKQMYLGLRREINLGKE